MIKNIPIICLTFFYFYVPAQNFSITYGFPELTPSTGFIDPSASPTVTGISFSPFAAHGTSANPNASARFSFTGWPVGATTSDDNYGNYTAVLSPTIYYEVTLCVDSGYTLNLTELNFDVRRSGTGIRNYCVRSSRDNFTNNLAVNTGTNSNLEVIPGDVFFWKYDSISTNNDQKGSGFNFNPSYSSMSDSITFRFYAWNAEANGGSFSMDNINFKGEVFNLGHTTTADPIENNSDHLIKILIFPNPISNAALKIKSKTKFSSIVILDVNNRVCHLETFDLPTDTFEINNLEMPDGVYLLKVSFENRLEYKKLIINKK